MFRIKIGLIVLGCVVIYFGAREWYLSSGARSQPQRITCAELVENGPGDNHHVQLVDHMLCSQSFVYEEKDGSRRWSKIWIPAVPRGGAWHRRILDLYEKDPNFDGELPTPGNIRVIVTSKSVFDHKDLSDLEDREAIQGMIVNRIESLGSEERKILEDSYPGVDFNRCYILEHRRRPSGGGKMLGFFFGGLLLILFGGFLIVRPLLTGPKYTT